MKGQFHKYTEYAISCGICGNYGNIDNYTYSVRRKEARSKGWVNHKTHGWICGTCARQLKG